jgi:hypothetical protein
MQVIEMHILIQGSKENEKLGGPPNRGDDGKGEGRRFGNNRAPVFSVRVDESPLY